MQFIHYAVFGLAYLRDMNFVTPPGIEKYKTIASRLFSESRKAGGVENCLEWRNMVTSSRRIKHRGCVTLNWDRLSLHMDASGLDAPSTYAYIVKKLAAARQIEYAELTFFGDTRYSQRGKAMLKGIEIVPRKSYSAHG